MLSWCILAFLAVSVSSQQHHDHNSAQIYQSVIEDIWLSSDANNDGIFERFELTGVFAHYDDDGNGIVTHHEYVDSIPKHSVMHEFTSAVFKEFDANNDHLLDPPDVDLLYTKMDNDGDTKVSKEEFTAFWMAILHKTAHLHGHGLHLGHN